MPVLNTFQDKQCLCMLTRPKCNESLIDQILISYRPEGKQLRVANGWKGSFCECENQKYIQT